MYDIELEWLIHYKCNYRCPYCFFDGLWKELERQNYYQSLGMWIDAWGRILNKYGNIRILITGGELFIYPSFVELIKELSKGFSIGFDTNLSCSDQKLIDFIDNTITKNITMALSFHPKFSDFKTFLTKALFLKENGCQVCIQYVSYPSQMKDMEYCRDQFEEN